MKLRILVTLALLALLVRSSDAAAQVTAHQGAQDPHEFRSPMVLDVPLPNVTQLAIGQAYRVSKDLGQYTCDDTNLAGQLTVEAKKPGRYEAGKDVFEFSGAAHVRKSHDRLVDISLTMKQGDRQLATGKAPTLSVEEKETRSFHVRLAVDHDALVQAFASQPPPTLEVTVVVRDND